MTKKELEEKLKAMRVELDKAHSELKELKAEKKELGELPEKAVGGYFDKEKKKWMLAQIDFNQYTGEAKVTEQKAVGSDFAMFNYYVNKFVAEEINLRSMRK